MSHPTENTVQTQAIRVSTLEAELRLQRRYLAQHLREAQKAGATIAQLAEWSGYSRRMIFYMLKENER